MPGTDLVHSETDSYLRIMPTTAVFGVDALALALSSICAAGQAVAASMRVVALLAPRHEPARVRAFVAELRKLEMLQLSGSLRPINPAASKSVLTP
jgi:hypothetical protein